MRDELVTPTSPLIERCRPENGQLKEKMGKPWIDRTGQVFGALTVVGLDHRVTGASFWNCLCSCGGSIICRGQNLICGQAFRCRECYTLTLRKAPQDLKEKRFGSLVAKECVGRDKANQQHNWFCLCDCGVYTTVRQCRLLKGIATRCWKCARTKHDRSKSNEYFMFMDAKSRAKKYGMEFTIEMDDIVIPETCPCLGIPIQRKMERPGNLSKEDRENGIKYRLNDNSASLDRIDSTKDYIKGNVWVISARANRIKNNSTPDELEMIASAVRRKQDQ